MKKRYLLSLMSVIILLSLIAQPVFADGIIIPDPPIHPPDEFVPPMSQLVIKYHHVDIIIENQLATTHVDQVFYNPNEWPVEGTYIFPLPADAVVSDFILWIDGEPVSGEVLDAAEARKKYEEIVRTMKDPALLEYVGRGAVQATIFPIPPDGERRIELEYSQVLTADNGLVEYVYPLNTEKFSADPIESVGISVSLSHQQPIRAVYSPTHKIDVIETNSREYTIGYEEQDSLPDKDFALYFSIGESEAAHLFTFRDPTELNDNDGYFMLLLAPSPEEQTEIISKDVLLVLDRSGSMEGEKFQQAQEALRYILQHLNPDDRFFITTFSTGVETFSKELSPIDEVGDALKWIDSLSAAGSTDINRALLETIDIANPEKPSYLIFLTDGLPTEGVTDSQMILSNISANTFNNLKLFSFGVGYDVDSFLLDSLSKEHHGLSSYVRPGEPLGEYLSAFYAKISTPVLTNLELDFEDLSVYDIYPQPLPDLFAGSQIILVGRYRNGGSITIELTGDVNSKLQTFEFEDQYFNEDNRSESDLLANIPRLWATRKIGYLLSSIRLNGLDQETIDQIIKLSIRYGIVTEYTSYLVTEPMPLGATNQEELARDVYEESLNAPQTVSGQEAVEKAAEEGELEQAEIAIPSSTNYGQVKTVWTRSFFLTQGIWMDTRYDPDTMELIKVAFLSDEYFLLSGTRPDVAAALALGDHVILLVDDLAYEIIPDGESDVNIVLPETVSPAESQEGKESLQEPAQGEENSLEQDGSLEEQPGQSQPAQELDQPEKSQSIYTLMFAVGITGLLVLFAILGRWMFMKKQ